MAHEDEFEYFVPLTYPKVKQNMYIISTHGRIYSLKKNKFMKPAIDEDGYYRISLVRSGTQKCEKIYIGVHKLVAWEFCSGYDESTGRIIPNHLNSDPSDNYFTNLEWVTYSENALYAFTENGHKQAIRGEDSNFAKYSEKQIRHVCELLEKGVKRSEISEITGVNKNYLSDIAKGSKWAHVSKDYDLPVVRKIKFKGFPKETQKEILKLLKKNYKPMKICEILGMEYNKTHKIAITNLRKKL